MRGVLGLAIGVVFGALFLGAGGSSLHGHVGLLLGSVGGFVIAGRELLV